MEEYIKQFGQDKNFEVIDSEFINSVYASAIIPLKFYSKAYLMSTAARGRWVEPDIQALDFAEIT